MVTPHGPGRSAAASTGQPSQRRKRRPAAATLALLRGTVYQDDTTAVDNLALFDCFDRWTAPLLGDYRGIALVTARKRLQHLVAAGAIVRVAGAVSGLGGREPDLYVLTQHGALILDCLYRRPRNTTRAPQLAASAPAADCPRPRSKHVAGGTTPHVLNCLRLALHQGWLDDERWSIMEHLDQCSGGGQPGDPIPDFALFSPGECIAVEVEGTLHRAHIAEKHRRYAALAGRLREQQPHGFKFFLTVVLTFPSDTDYRNALRLHELAFARQERSYALAVARLSAVLATPEGTSLWVEEGVDREAIHRREHDHHERQRRLYDGW